MKYEDVVIADNIGKKFNVEMKGGSLKTLIVNFSELHQECNFVEEREGSRGFWGINKEDIKYILPNAHSATIFQSEFLASQTLVTEEVTYSQDEDGNIMISQDGMYITLTPQQQIALKYLLEAHIDTLQFAWSKL